MSWFERIGVVRCLLVLLMTVCPLAAYSAEFFYKGAIDNKYPIEMTLELSVVNKFAEDLNSKYQLKGSYVYTKYNTPIALEGTITDTGIELKENNETKFTLYRWDTDVIRLAGDWQRKNKSLDVTLTRVIKDNDKVNVFHGYLQGSAVSLVFTTSIINVANFKHRPIEEQISSIKGMLLSHNSNSMVPFYGSWGRGAMQLHFPNEDDATDILLFENFDPRNSDFNAHWISESQQQQINFTRAIIEPEEYWHSIHNDLFQIRLFSPDHETQDPYMALEVYGNQRQTLLYRNLEVYCNKNDWLSGTPPQLGDFDFDDNMDVRLHCMSHNKSSSSVFLLSAFADKDGASPYKLTSNYSTPDRYDADNEYVVIKTHYRSSVREDFYSWGNGGWLEHRKTVCYKRKPNGEKQPQEPKDCIKIVLEG